MTNSILTFPILIPLISGVLVLLIPARVRTLKEVLVLVSTLANLFLGVILFKGNFEFNLPWLGYGMDLSLRLYHFSAFIILATSVFAFLISMYSAAFLHGKEHSNQFYSYILLSFAFINGAVLADNLILMLFFWEGLLLTLFGLIYIGKKSAFKTAIKAVIIVGISDLCLMFGIALVGYLSGTLTISKINLPLNSLGSIAFVFLMIGAISKAGSMPFHSWIPDASIDAPLPFMAIFPAALEKLLGIYFLTRISLDMFQLDAGSWVSTMLMIIGSITIIFAVMMALIQKDYKKLLSYHAISQVGYMILGIGTALPVGIVGGLFHMINNALYKSCLFLTGGAVEKQAGTTDLSQLGGLRVKMPLTFACFVITAVSISGVPPFNGFFSKELIYDGALERGLIFYIVAVTGSFFTAASFLKLGHAAFLGKLNARNEKVKEAPFMMLAPMIIIAALCILFGVYNYLPLNTFIQPILGQERLGNHNFSGFGVNITLFVITLVVLFAAFLNHFFAARAKGSGLEAVDYIHYAPVLSAIYERAEKRFFDPYEIGLKAARKFSLLAFWLDRKIDALYDKLAVNFTYALTAKIKRLHDGNYVTYLTWSLAAMFLVLAVMLFKK